MIQNTWQGYPFPLPLVSFVLLVMRFVGSTRRPNIDKGEGKGAVFIRVPQNTSLYDSAPTVLSRIVLCSAWQVLYVS